MGVEDDTKRAHGSILDAEGRGKGQREGVRGHEGPHGRPSENLCHAPRPFAVGTPYATPRPRAPLLRESPA